MSSSTKLDPNALNFNVTVDDFDSILTYAEQSAWDTPDPFSASYHPGSSEYLLGTYHHTSSSDKDRTTVNLNFTGGAIYAYGAGGPQYGRYGYAIDGRVVEGNAYRKDGNASFPFELVKLDDLEYTQHTFSIWNLGAKADGEGSEFLLDFIRFTVQLGPPGATYTNKTLEETDPALNYTGEWGNNKSGNFSGGGSTYTNGDGASVSLTFEGTAVYVLGDKKNDHGEYTVSLDSLAPITLSGVSGCGGEFGMTCEQQQPTIKYFASNLGEGKHNLTVTNRAGVNSSYFDLDSVVISVPSEYAVRNLTVSSSNSPSANGNGNEPSAGNGSLRVGAYSSLEIWLTLMVVLMVWTRR